jgi:hypothetical protein
LSSLAIIILFLSGLLLACSFWPDHDCTSEANAVATAFPNWQNGLHQCDGLKPDLDLKRSLMQETRRNQKREYKDLRSSAYQGIGGTIVGGISGGLAGELIGGGLGIIGVYLEEISYGEVYDNYISKRTDFYQAKYAYLLCKDNQEYLLNTLVSAIESLQSCWL